MRSKTSLVVVILILSACTTMKPDDFINTTPKLDIFDYFSGQTQAWGMFEDRFGNVRRQFNVDIMGKIENNALVLDEQFHYSDGERDHRTWTIIPTGEDSYSGRAADIIDEAQGRASGNALNWNYEMDLKVGDSSWRVTFDDWMFLQSDGVLINRAKVKKFGIEIGSVTLFFKKT